ncbi:hypothetical protein [Ectothiorhodospira lacustris]|uniref:hypothetical protein n=1 Tax=Ectothiorhodospira lacustris TaxID=2899127 RepID=UPI001EE8D022|nr:hypothetical protein [Ectothiorhodospira lacustris]MCG5501228.1 hypothetical protein [Ectothiorhodospira lacustris]MCG5511012.1 hypothetical protein [Ectothiorhodospira lacustris]MCG5522742.1 hypothetical protein [Ectothiorhodospira lacustris]
MHRIGRYSVVVGALLTLVGMIVGFGSMFSGADELAKYFLSLVPLGVLTVFTGLVTVVLTEQKQEG